MSEEATKTVYRVRNLIDPAQLKKDLSYSLADLSSAMVDQASLFAHYGTLAARASRQVDDVKFLLETVEARTYRKKRDVLVTKGDKFTEKQLENAVATDPEVVRFKRALNEAKQIEASAKIAAEAFRHRRDMLVQQGLISREEMKGEVSINRRRAVDDEIEAQKQRYLDRATSNS